MVQTDIAPQRDDAAHLAWIQDQLGERFVCGVILHTGPGSFELGEGIAALPMAATTGLDGARSLATF